MNAYLEECIDAAKSIDTAKLAATPLGEEIGWESGSESDFHILGQFPVRQMMQWVGIKGPRRRSSNPKNRLHQEVRFIGWCTEASPDLRPLVPSFIGLVSVEGSKATALITEDASRGNSVDVWSNPTSARSRELIRVAFSDFGEGCELQSAELKRTTAFEVDGQERLLDFTPPPVLYRTANAPDAYLDLHGDIMDAIPDLTITLPFESRLGQDLHKQYDTLLHF